MKNYRTRYSVVLVTILIITFALCLYFPIMYYENKGIVPLLVICGIILIICPFFYIRYTIDGQNLTIKTGPFKSSIDIKEIKSIEPSSSILSSPAGSMKRICISYGKYDEVLISPSNQDDFIQELLEINPDIKLINL